MTDCAETRYSDLSSAALAKLEGKLASKACADLSYPIAALDSCGAPASVAELASCIAGNADQAAATLAVHFLSLPAPTTTTTTSTTITTTTTDTTSTTIPVGDPACPASATVVVHSRDTNLSCVTNADCTPGTCEAGECTRSTQADMGWTGFGHDTDTNEGDLVKLKLYCPGPAPACGQCDIVGVDPAPGNCRCQNDPRIVCDNPMVAHASECGGAACQCYTSTPTPSSSGDTPLCNVERFAESPSGELDVDTGAMSIVARRRLTVHLGTETRDPCPTCVGDTIAGDGDRAGTCHGGQSDGLSCDAMSANQSFPAPGGSAGPAYSLDCLPSIGTNISGQGLLLDLEVGTGSFAVAAGLSCGDLAPGLDCPCLLCCTDPGVACNSDFDCASQEGRCSLSTGFSPALCGMNADCLGRDAGICNSNTNRCSGASSIECSMNADCDSVDLGICGPSTCSTRGNGENPFPNMCEDLACTDLGNGEGECTTGPDTKFCDGVLEANGSGIHTCTDDVECSAGILGVDAGSCALVQRQKCFLDPITATGTASPGHPVIAATTCMPPTSGAGKNAAVGLPGPLRILQQTTLTSWCGSVAYSPGTGCP